MQPKDPIAQLDRMRAGTEYKFRLRVRDLDVRGRPLTMAEHMAIYDNVAAQLKRLPPQQQTAAREAELLASAILEKATTSAPDTTDPELTAYIIGYMTPDELQFLYKQWLDESARVSPAIEDIPEKELFEMVDHVKKNGDSALTALSRSQLCALVKYWLTLLD